MLKKEALEAQYHHPILKKYGAMAKEVGGSRWYGLHHGRSYGLLLAEWFALRYGRIRLGRMVLFGRLGALSMDNNCASVAFPDFTRGYWNKVEGYKHQYASPEAEATTEAAAAAYTKSQKEATAKFKLWNLYDAVAAAKKANNAKAFEVGYC